LQFVTHEGEEIEEEMSIGGRRGRKRNIAKEMI
jgi:hypothetical protein